MSRQITWSLLSLSLLTGCDFTVRTQQGYAPVQPVAFSHALHAGNYGVSCNYCHTGVEVSRNAGFPALSTCMNCHSQVKTESPEIKKLSEAQLAGKAIQWIKVHRLPDHAYFNHASHVTAGVNCTNCHGPVHQMVRIEQATRMSMGFCLDCHRSTGEASTLDPRPGQLASTPAPNGTDGASAPVPSSHRSLKPPTDCNACHR